MDKPALHPLDVIASDISLVEVTPVTSSKGDYLQSPIIAAGLQSQPFFFDPNMAQNMYQNQQFDLQYQSTQNVFPIDASQSWTSLNSQQSYFPPQPSSLPEQPASVAMSSTSPIRHDYVPLAKRPSIASSVNSAFSDGDEHSNHGEAGERRRERRRAQNRAAQRAFRARKEVCGRFLLRNKANQLAGNYQRVLNKT